MNKHNERAEFERWARAQPWIKDLQRYDESHPKWPGQYGHCDTEHAWNAWQACRAAMLEAQPAEQENGQEVAVGAALRPDYEQIIDNYIDEYEMRGETEYGYDTGYTPNENDKALLKDAFMGFDFSALYTTPPAQPAREWVGLTQEERLYFLNEIMEYGTGFVSPIDAVVRNIESTLREKNAGLPAADKAGEDESVAFDHYKVVVDALSNLLGQVEKFCVENGEADFETGEALMAMEAVCEYENTRPQPQAAVPDENRCIRELREYAAKNPGTYIFPGWDGNRVTKYLAAAPKPQDDLPAILKKQAS